MEFEPAAVADYSTTLSIDCGEAGVIEVLVVAMGTDTPELTVCDGTDTEEHLPIYGYYFDSSITNTQMLYPAEMLASLVNCKITEIKFYPTDAMGLTSGVALVEMGMTEETSPSADIEGLVNVGKIAPTGGETELVVTLDEPFLYEGGTLALRTSMESIGNYARVYFYGQNQEEQTGFCQWSNYGSNNYMFLPKMTIIYEKNSTSAVSKVGTDAAVKAVKFVNTMGQVSNAPFQGVNIVVTEYTDGTFQTAKVVK